jgi:hypothetical protein
MLTYLDTAFQLKRLQNLNEIALYITAIEGRSRKHDEKD